MSTLRLAVILPLLAAGCAGANSPPTPMPPATIETTTFAPALGVDLAASTKTPGGLYYRDLVVGTGTEVGKGRTIGVRYTGSFTNGSQFDGNTTGGAPLSFRVGNREVIDGWDQGVVGMRVGGTRQLIIPPSLAYGPNGYGPIPGNAVLVFTVEILSAQ